MNYLNSLILEGNVVEDPVSVKRSDTTSSSNKCIFSLNYTKYYPNDTRKNTKEDSIFEIHALDNLGAQCHEILKKGQGVRVIGFLKQIPYQDEEGHTHKKVVVIAEHIEFKPFKLNLEATTEGE